MALIVHWHRDGPFLVLRYRKNKKQKERYLGTLYVSPAPFLDLIIENVGRESITIDELKLLQQETDKSWAKTWEKLRHGTTATQFRD